jgi:hypothetical protein
LEPTFRRRRGIGQLWDQRNIGIKWDIRDRWIFREQWHFGGKWLVRHFRYIGNGSFGK